MPIPSPPTSDAPPPYPAAEAREPLPAQTPLPFYKAAYLDNPPPRYPRLAKDQGWQGRVSVRTHILASGEVGEVRLERSSGHEILDAAAMDAIKGWRFAAARRGDQPVDSWVIIPINFD